MRMARIVGEGDIAAQTAQVLRNIKTALSAAGAGPQHVVKWNLFVVEGQDITSGYAAFQTAWGQQTSPPPVITAAFVSALARPEFLVEMDAIAVVPEESPRRNLRVGHSRGLIVGKTGADTRI